MGRQAIDPKTSQRDVSGSENAVGIGSTFDLWCYPFGQGRSRCDIDKLFHSIVIQKRRPNLHYSHRDSNLVPSVHSESETLQASCRRSCRLRGKCRHRPKTALRVQQQLSRRTILSWTRCSMTQNDSVHPARAVKVSNSKAPDCRLGCNGWFWRSQVLDCEKSFCRSSCLDCSDASQPLRR